MRQLLISSADIVETPRTEYNDQKERRRRVTPFLIAFEELIYLNVRILSTRLARRSNEKISNLLVTPTRNENK